MYRFCPDLALFRLHLTRLVLLVATGAAGLTTSGCGEDPKPAAKVDTAVTTDTTAGTDAAALTDTSTTVDTTAGTDTQATDVAVAAKSCGELLPCALDCGPKDAAACMATCAKPGSPAAKTDLQAIADCATDLCGDVTQTAAFSSCVLGSCWPKLATCTGSGNGQETCGQTVGCMARCAFGDADCRFACLQRGGADTGNAAAWLGCAETKCAGAASPDSYAACVAAGCSAELTACQPSGNNCVAHSSCQARCPASLPGMPNACVQICDLLALPAAVTAADDYAACKTQCEGVLDANCIAKQCKTQQEACYGTQSSGESCFDVYECIKNECEGIGSPDPCIYGCLQAASNTATEAYVAYEGCLLVALGEAQAKAVGCSFPFDEKTCIGVLNGFCGKQSSTCFKPN
jgi:hypothetical protein